MYTDQHRMIGREVSYYNKFLVHQILKDSRMVVRMSRMQRSATSFRVASIAGCRGCRSNKLSIPLELTSSVTSSHQKPAALPASTKSKYLAHFLSLAPATIDSYLTLNSSNHSSDWCSLHQTMSGWRLVVAVIWWGKE